MISIYTLRRPLSFALVIPAVSAPALALQVCGVHPGDCSGGTQHSQVQADSTGPVPVQFGPNNESLSIPMFDPNERAAFHGTTPENIVLRQVDVRLILTPLLFDVSVVNTSPKTACDFVQDFLLRSTLQPNLPLGTPPVELDYNFFWTTPLAPGEQATRNLGDFIPPEPPFKAHCFAQGGSLANYLGAGILTWDVELFGFDLAGGGDCVQFNFALQALADARVEVTYQYCVEETQPPPSGGSSLGPGSLLIYPEFDNRPGVACLISATNLDASGNGDVDVEFTYVRRFDSAGGDISCTEFNATHRLTPKDNFTALARFHGPTGERGYVYAFAKDPLTGQPITHNHLIGDVRIMDGVSMSDYSMRPFTYAGIEGADINGNGLRDLDGLEYQESPNVIHVPRFLGVQSGLGADLILINLTGGVEFTTTADLYVYNDNEEIFSAEYTFYCWDKVPLLDISQLFGNAFLQSSIDDPLEIFGAPQVEAGWFEFWGNAAFSSAATIDDPAVLGVLVEHSRQGSAAHLPYATGSNPNGKLLPLDLFGDFGWK